MGDIDMLFSIVNLILAVIGKLERKLESAAVCPKDINSLHQLHPQSPLYSYSSQSHLSSSGSVSTASQVRSFFCPLVYLE